MQFAARRCEVGIDARYRPPKARRVIHVPEMRELVRDDIIDERETHVYKPPAKPHPTVGRAGAPLRARRGKRDAAHFDGPRLFKATIVAGS